MAVTPGGDHDLEALHEDLLTADPTGQEGIHRNTATSRGEQVSAGQGARFAAALTAQAAEAEIAAATAQARRTAAVLADYASQTEPELSNAKATAEPDTAVTAPDGDWDAERARQIAAEQDAVAAGVWHDQALHDRVSGLKAGADDADTWQSEAG